MPEKMDVLKAFREAGRHMLLMGMNSSHSGNMSVRGGDDIYITRSGAMLGILEESDMVKVALEREKDPVASMEYPVHRAIYKASKALAVIHCHPVHSIALSLSKDSIEPLDMEGRIILGSVPVLSVHDVLPENIGNHLASGKACVVVKGHGAFAAAGSLYEALHLITSLEMSARILLLSQGRSL